MGKSTFSGPVRSLGGFNTVGYNNEITVADGFVNLSLTAEDHGGRLLVILDAANVITLPAIVTTEPSDKTDPNQVCNLGLTFRLLYGVVASAAVVTTAAADNFVGSIGMHKEGTGLVQAFFAATGANDNITMNGTTTGGLIDSYIEVTATSRGWLCSQSVPMGSGSLSSPFS
mgnify:CR=1 FL=1|tara:strand:+ start:141 stop:656 length:516 start_codon:yes stop_codon:yes gene_type:complete